MVTFDDAIDDKHELVALQMRVEGVYIWPFRQLRLVATRLSCLSEFSQFHLRNLF